MVGHCLGMRKGVLGWVNIADCGKSINGRNSLGPCKKISITKSMGKFYSYKILELSIVVLNEAPFHPNLIEIDNQ